jgi:hypothetical protein
MLKLFLSSLLAASSLFVGCSHANIKPMNTPDSPVKRKERTEGYLTSLGVPVNPHLPLVEGESEVRLREPKEVAKRTIILYALVAVAHQADRKRATSWLKREGLWESVSPKEKDFLESDDPPEQDRVEASWRAESLWTLLWALRKTERLELPKEMCDTQLIQQIMPAPESSCTEFINQATLRPPSEILDATDLIYRVHWAAVDARLNGKETPGGFHPGIIYERHYALNWLVWYADEWDDVTTDT